MYVCNAHSNRFFFFVSRWHRAISWPSVLRDKNYKTLFFEFWFVAMATKFGLFLQKNHIASSFSFFDAIEPFFWPLVLRDPLYKKLFFDFWFRSPNPQNWLPTIRQKKSAITRLVWHIDRRCLHLSGGFQGWPIQWNHTKCCGVDPCCHGNEIWAKIAYNSTCTADSPQMFHPSRGFSGMADSMQPCKILYGGPLLPWQRHLR